MIEIIPYRAPHFGELMKERGINLFFDVLEAPAYGAALESAGPAWSALRDGRIVGCAGLKTEWPGRATAWAVLSPHVGSAMTTVHRCALIALRNGPYRRVEAAVAEQYTVGHRWVNLLGFKKEVERAPNYLPDGRAATLYAFLKGDVCR